MKDYKVAVRLLGAYTAERFDVWALAGRAKASCRAHIMGALLDRKATQRESGVTALRSEFYSQMGIKGSCLAVREDVFIASCRKLLAPRGDLARTGVSSCCGTFWRME